MSRPQRDPCLALVRRLDFLLDELRAAWATGRRVAVSITGGQRLEGHVQHVSTTGAFVDVAAGRVFADEILAVHLPSLLGDSTARPSTPFHGDGHAVFVHPDQIPLWEATA